MKKQHFEDVAEQAFMETMAAYAIKFGKKLYEPIFPAAVTLFSRIHIIISR